MSYPEIPADRNPVPFRWRAALDNYEPTREYAYGTATAYVTFDGEDTAVRIEDGLDLLRDAHRSLFVIDNGRTAEPFYVAGWHGGNPSPSYPKGHRPYILLRPFPTNPNNRTRADNGRVIDYSDWMLGPRRTYHLKVWEA
jgi:hypothetical protein